MTADCFRGLKGVEYHWSIIIMYTGSTMIDPCAPLRPTWKNGLVISCTRLTYANVNATISTERRVGGPGGVNLRAHPRNSRQEAKIGGLVFRARACSANSTRD